MRARRRRLLGAGGLTTLLFASVFGLVSAASGAPKTTAPLGEGASPSITSLAAGLAPIADDIGTPSIVDAAPGNAGVSLSWTYTALAGDEGAEAAAMGWQINTYDASGTTQLSQTDCWTLQVDCAATSYTVAGLTNGTAYRFKVVHVDKTIDPATHLPEVPVETSSSALSSPVTPATVPGAPSAVSATSNQNGQSLVSWTAPADDGGAPLSGYQVASVPSSAGCTTPDATTTQCTVSGLENGTTYQFTVTASNSMGPSAPSSPAASGTPATTPGQASIARWSVTSGSATLTITPPDDGGLSITGYLVRVNGSTESTPRTLSNSMLKLIHLLPATSNTVSLAAQNPLGTGPWSNPVKVLTSPASPLVASLPSVGSPLGGRPITINGDGMKSGSVIDLQFHSNPQTIGSATVDSTGSFSITGAFPSSVAPEVHQLILTGTSATGTPTTAVWYLSVDKNGILTAVAGPNPSPIPAWALATALAAPPVVAAHVTASTIAPVSPTIPPRAEALPAPIRTPAPVVAPAPGYNPLLDVTTAQTTAIGASLLLAMLGATAAMGSVTASSVLGRAGVATAATRRLESGGESKREVGIEHTKIKVSRLGTEAIAASQRSWTWQIPLTTAFVGSMASMATWVGRASSALFKIADDGAYLRASLGIFTLLGYLGAVGLGVVAVFNVHGHPMPPAWPIFAAMMVVGVLDAFAGFLTGLAYLLGVIFSGGWTDLAGVRVSMAVVAACVVVIIAASYLRPLRRPPAKSIEGWFDRFGDVIIAALVAMFVGSRIILALPAFADRRLSIVAHYVAITLIVGAGVVLRYSLETLVARRYGDQLVAAQAPETARPSHLAHAIALIIGALGFMLFTVAFVGWTWALWTGVTLVAIRSLSHRFKGHFPKVRGFNRITPQGVLKFVLLLVVCEALAAILRATVPDRVHLVLLSSVLLIVPTVIFELGNAVSETRTPYEMTWRLRLGGVVLVAFGFCLAVGLISFG